MLSVWEFLEGSCVEGVSSVLRVLVLCDEDVGFPVWRVCEYSVSKV